MSRLWRFVPAVNRPWNPAYREVWDAMTHRERQISFLIDAVIVFLAALACLAGWRLG